MIVRSAPLFAALALLAAPALAQDNPDIGPPPPLPGETFEPAPPPAPAGGDGWEGEWQGEWAPDGTYRGVWTGTYIEPDGVATAPLIQRAIPASPFSLEQRNGWLAQCRNTYLQAGASLGGADGQPDLCEAQLLQYERSYAAPAYGAPTYGAPVYGAPAYGTPTYGAPYAYGQTGYGYPYAPVVWVRVPIVREPAVPVAAPIEVIEQ